MADVQKIYSVLHDAHRSKLRRQKLITSPSVPLINHCNAGNFSCDAVSEFCKTVRERTGYSLVRLHTGWKFRPNACGSRKSTYRGRCEKCRERVQLVGSWITKICRMQRLVSTIEMIGFHPPPRHSDDGLQRLGYDGASPETEDRELWIRELVVSGIIDKEE